MKTMKLIPLFVLSLILTTANTQSIAQKKNTLEMLQANKWERVHKSYNYLVEFTKGTIVTIFKTGDQSMTIINDFYLSNNLDSVYNKMLIPVKSKMKYMIVQDSNDDKQTTISEIVKLDDEELIVVPIISDKQSLVKKAPIVYKAVRYR